MIKKYSATVIGIIFTGSCLLLYYTFVIPFLIMLPVPLVLETLFERFYGKQDYSVIGQSMVIALLVIFLGLTALFFTRFIRQIRKVQTYKAFQVFLYMILILFVVHPLIFYIDLSKDWSRANDGQFILSITDTFQFSSFSFVVLGLIIDSLKIFRNKNEGTETVGQL
jgi:hypothetical protein